MKKITKALLIILTSLMVLTGCTSEKPQPDDRYDNEAEQINRTNNGSSIVDYLYEEKNGNIVISNLSINMALAMLLEGANGNTQKELEDYLGYSKEEAKTVCKELLDYLKEYIDQQTRDNGNGEKYDSGLGFVELANSLWFDNKAEIKEEYQKLLAYYFGAAAENLDFKDPDSATIINKWVSDKTRGLIDGIVDKDTLKFMNMMLINALYMKGSWAARYGIREPGMFDGKETEVMKGEVSEYFENEMATAFSKSIYGGFEMIAILPKAEGEFTLESLDIDGLLKTRTLDYDVDTVFPVLDINYDANLNDVLKALGIKDVFDSDRSDLSDISDYPLYVSDVVHKTHIKADENGFEGAAVTAIHMMRTVSFNPYRKERKQVIIDRPFVFMILDRNTGTAIFTGKVVSLSE